jgi:phosphoglucosamine mutase
MVRFPQTIVNVRVDRHRDLGQLASVKDAIASLERRLAGRGRVLVRPSGTEPVVRVMVEGEDEARVQADAAEIADAVARAYAAEGG